MEAFDTILRQDFPLISVIIAVYNKGPYLRETVQSVLNQEYPNLEVLIIDDGSRDDSASVIDSLPNLFPTLTFQIFHTTNHGVSYARNYLIERAKGRLVSIIDADDIMQPGFLRDGLAKLRSDRADLVYTDVEIFGMETGSWAPQGFDAYQVRYNNCACSLQIYDRELWKKAGGYKVSMPFNEDWDLLVNISRFTTQITKLPGSYLRYRRTDSGLFQNFIRDTWPQSVSMLITANENLYGAEEVLWAFEQLKSMKPEWQKKLFEQNIKHPKEPFLKLWLGLYEERLGKFTEAINYYAEAVIHSAEKWWLPLFRIAQLVEGIDKMAAVQAYHKVRILRPDMGKAVNERIKVLCQ